MRKILILNGQYLPGYKGGGPIRSIQNMVESLSDEYEFYILTSDRDFREEKPYENIETNKWIKMNGYNVYYMTPEKQTLFGFKKVINNLNYDTLYLNGFFSPIFTIKPLILRKLGLLSNNKVIICARGDFSKGHLNIKKIKKIIYIKLIKLIGLYKNVIWHATSELEIADLKDVFPKLKYLYSPNLSSKSSNNSVKAEYKKEANKVNLIFLSRICKKKNLIYALERLKEVNKNIKVNFDIYGPKEDIEYWKECEKVIKELDKNVKVNYIGEITPSNIGKTFKNYDSFLFPTLGENYGHVIVEAISNGCIPIISDQTPWRNLSEQFVGFDIPLENKNEFVNSIEKIAYMDLESVLEYKRNNYEYYAKNIFNPKNIELTRIMLNGDIKKI